MLGLVIALTVEYSTYFEPKGTKCDKSDNNQLWGILWWTYRKLFDCFVNEHETEFSNPATLYLGAWCDGPNFLSEKEW